MTQEEQAPQQVGIQSNSGGDITIEQSQVYIAGGDLHIHYSQYSSPVGVPNLSQDRAVLPQQLSRPPSSTLSEPQRLFLVTFLSQAGEQAIDEKFSFVRYRGTRYVRWKQVKVAVNLSDEDLLELARLGYLQIYTNPPSIIFTKLTLEAANVT